MNPEVGSTITSPRLSPRGFRKLLAWQKSHQLVLDIYSATQQFPSHELYGLISQIRRAAVSVPSNIAEGYTRGSPGEFRRGRTIAKGSLAEVEYYLELSRDLGYLDLPRYDALSQQLAEAGSILEGLLKAVAKRLELNRA